MNNYKHLFPYFNTSKITYLDSAASTHKPLSVVNTIADFYTKNYASVHRGLYESSEKATQAYEHARLTIARFINAQSHEVAFTKGATESINCFAHSWALHHLKANDEILITQAEHHANLIPWQYVAQATGARLKFIPLDKETFLLNNPATAISPQTKLLAVPRHSNVLSNIWKNGDFEKTVARARDVGAVILLDMSQSAAHHTIDAQELHADALVFSGHKMFGPTGIGALYINEKLHDQLHPYLRGGAAVESVSWHTTTFKQMPHLLEAGTPPIAQALGLAKAVEFINQEINFNELAQHEGSLCSQLISGLKSFNKIHIFGNQKHIKEEGHTVSFAIDGIHGHDFAAFCATKNIALRAGHHCAQPLVQEVLGKQSIVRASVSAYNSSLDVDHLLSVLDEAFSLFSPEGL